MTSKQQPIFVISDLHIGNGSSRDSLLRAKRADQLQEFLDHVEHQQGQLLIAGDLMELWMFPLEQILERWTRLFDRMATMGAIYIPGNHDAAVATTHVGLHPLLGQVVEPFTQTIGTRSFHFMHGHEFDPFVPSQGHQWQRTYQALTRCANVRHRIPLSLHDRIADLLMEWGEHLIKLGQRLGSNLQYVLHEELVLLCETHDHLKDLSTRTLKLLSRQFHYRDEVQYDVAIAGHTHRPGRFCEHYYNSGSWTKAINTFLRIEPDGHTQLFNWTGQGPVVNPVLVGQR